MLDCGEYKRERTSSDTRLEYECEGTSGAWQQGEYKCEGTSGGNKENRCGPRELAVATGRIGVGRGN